MITIRADVSYVGIAETVHLYREDVKVLLWINNSLFFLVLLKSCSKGPLPAVTKSLFGLNAIFSTIKMYRPQFALYFLCIPIPEAHLLNIGEIKIKNYSSHFVNLFASYDLFFVDSPRVLA